MAESPVLVRWILRATVPGLLCNLLGIVSKFGGDEIKIPIAFAMLATPLVGLFYLIALGRRYVAAGLGSSVVLFVLGFGAVNLLLWGAGCVLLLSES